MKIPSKFRSKLFPWNKNNTPNHLTQARFYVTGNTVLSLIRVAHSHIQFKISTDSLTSVFLLFPTQFKMLRLFETWPWCNLKFFGNKPKERISKRVFQENKARKCFEKTNISYPLIRTRTYAYQHVRIRE